MAQQILFCISTVACPSFILHSLGAWLCMFKRSTVYRYKKRNPNFAANINMSMMCLRIEKFRVRNSEFQKCYISVLFPDWGLPKLILLLIPLILIAYRFNAGLHPFRAEPKQSTAQYSIPNSSIPRHYIIPRHRTTNARCIQPVASFLQFWPKEDRNWIIDA